MLERTVMYWLAINRDWTTIAELREDIIPLVLNADLLEALEGLLRRSLIERSSYTLIEPHLSTQSGRHRTGYTQQSVVMEYVTDRLIQQIIDELKTQSISLFCSHALTKTTVKNYIQHSQLRLILQPIASQFYAAFSSTEARSSSISKLSYPPFALLPPFHSTLNSQNPKLKIMLAATSSTFAVVCNWI